MAAPSTNTHLLRRVADAYGGEVKEAAEDVLAAVEAHREARAAVVAAEQAVKEAKKHDHQAATRAVEAGEPIPEATAPAAVATLEQATRIAAAREQLVRKANLRYIEVITGDAGQEGQARARELLAAKCDQVRDRLADVRRAAEGVGQLAELVGYADEARRAMRTHKRFPTSPVVRTMFISVDGRSVEFAQATDALAHALPA